MCPSVLHMADCCGKFTISALVTPQYMNFKGCGAFTGETAVKQLEYMSCKGFDSDRWALEEPPKRGREQSVAHPSRASEALAHAYRGR